VRRAFSRRQDQVTGQDFSHRKVWVTQRLAELSQSFAINICAYAAMSNHYHLVLHIDAVRARAWLDAEVVRRWGLLFALPLLVTKHLNCKLNGKLNTGVALALLAGLRHRLGNLS
jgi:hypothetical protein